MPQALIDDDLWARIEPLLPRRRRRNRQYAGRAPIPDRAVLTGILFVLRTGLPWNMLPREMGCGSGTTCWRRLVRWQRAGVWKRLHTVLLNELRRRGQIDLARAVVDSSSLRALRGEKNWTEPYRSPQGRVETSCSHRRARDSAGRAADRRTSSRRDPIAPPGRRHAAAAGACRATGPQTAVGPRRSRLRFAAASQPTAGARDRLAAGEARPTTRQRLGPDALGRRAHPGMAASFSPLGRAVRTPTLYSRGVSHVSVLTRLLVLLATSYLISQRALSLSRAARAASCSASFLLGPVDSASASPLTR